MKHTFSTTVFAFILLLASCKNDASLYSAKLEKELAGLNKLTLTEKEQFSALSLIADSANLSFPIYSVAGERLTQAQVREKEMNVTVDVFGNSLKDIKAVVFRDLTQAELAEIFKRSEEAHKWHDKAIEELKSKPAPIFSAKDINGNVVDLAALRGKVVVLNFWFIHCFACVQEMPELNQTVQEFKGKDVAFMGFTFDKEEDTKWFLQHTKFDYDIIADARNIFDQYRGNACPMNIVIDKKGNIIYAETGYQPAANPNQKNLKAAIKAALGEVERS